jgi:hypothetical protein
MLGGMYGGAPVAQRLMGPVVVVPVAPVPNDPCCLLEHTCCHKLFFQASKESLDDSLDRLPKAATLEDQPVVNPQDRRLPDG